jgi:hypothetical protein
MYLKVIAGLPFLMADNVTGKLKKDINHWEFIKCQQNSSM